MKARVKATGEVFKIASYATIPMECCDSFGEPLRFCFDEVEILSEGNDLKESEAPDYWARLEHQYAGMAMQGILSNEAMQKELMRVFGKEECIEDIIVDYAKDMALLLVRKMKEVDQ